MDKIPKDGWIYRWGKAVLISVLLGEAVTILMLLFCSFLMLRMDLPLYLTDILVALSGAAGGFLSGYVCGRILKERGLLLGAICGGVQVVLLMLFSFSTETVISPLFLILKFAAILLCAVFGGILGVNHRKRVKY